MLACNPPSMVFHICGACVCVCVWIASSLVYGAHIFSTRFFTHENLIILAKLRTFIVRSSLWANPKRSKKQQQPLLFCLQIESIMRICSWCTWAREDAVKFKLKLTNCSNKSRSKFNHKIHRFFFFGYQYGAVFVFALHWQRRLFPLQIVGAIYRWVVAIIHWIGSREFNQKIKTLAASFHSSNFDALNFGFRISFALIT